MPWGGVYSPEQLLANKNDNVVGKRLIRTIPNTYEDIVSSASIGNEASGQLDSHVLTTESLIHMRDC